MPEPALIGTYPHPGIPGATITAGRAHVVPWLQEHLSRPRPLVLDIETFGVDLDGYRIKAVVLGVPEAALVIDPRDYAQAVVIRPAADYASQLIMHKANFDAPSLVINGLIDPQTVDKTVCTMVKARCATPGDTVKKTLDACVKRYFGVTSQHKIEDMFKALGLTKTEGYTRLDVDSPTYLMGAAADGVMTARLAPVLHQACLDLLLRGHPFTHWAITDPAEAEWELEKHQIANRWGIRQTIAGLAVDLDFLDRFEQEFGAERAAGVRELAAAGVDPGNGNHLAAYLTKVGAMPPNHPQTDGGAPKMDKTAVATLVHPLARTFAKIKKMDKISTYLEKCRTMSVMDGRIHPCTEILKAVHGRSSMTGIEIHQFPAGARGIILLPEGTSVDWTAQEPMLGMNFAGDDEAIASYERGERIYTYIADFARIRDKQAKIVLLGGMYGEGLSKLSADLGLDPGPYWTKRDGTVVASYKAAKAIQDATWSALPRTRQMLEDLKKVAGQYKMVMTMNGRIVPISSGFQPWDGKWSVQVHKGGNGVVCGSAADMLMDTIVECERIGIGPAVYFNMHDELAVHRDVSRDVQMIMQRVSPRMARATGRTPLIRTDLQYMGERWRGEEK